MTIPARNRSAGNTLPTFVCHRDAALKEWEARSTRKWRLNLREYASFVMLSSASDAELSMTLEIRPKPKVPPKNRG